MQVKGNGPYNDILTLDGEAIVRTNVIKYLGYMISENGNMTTHLKKRKSITMALISTLKSQGLLDENVNIKAKILVFKSFIRSTLQYGMENIKITDNIK